MFRNLLSPKGAPETTGEMRDQIAELTQEIEAKNDFLRFWNHDLGGIVQGIKSALQLLKTAEDGEDLVDTIEGCLAGCQLLTDIHTNTGQFLNGNEDTVTITTIDVEECLAPVISLYQPFAKYRDTTIGLEMCIDSSFPIMSDQIKLRRIICNLLNNAIKFSPRGQSVVVRVRNTQHHLFIEVKDSGIGIPKEQQAFIFMPYVRLDQKAAGLGIGLTISKALAEQLNGNLIVTSALGVGSTFTLVLPFATQDSQHLYTVNNK